MLVLQSAICNLQSKMRVSAKAEYACIAMLELAANYAEPHPVRVKSIHDRHDISQRFLVQILLQLKAAGLVISVRGAAGGYQLARAPAEISLADIIRAVDPSATPQPVPAGQARRRSKSPGPVAESGATHALRSVWEEVHAREQRLLEEVTLAELVRRMQLSNELSYQI